MVDCQDVAGGQDPRTTEGQRAQSADLHRRNLLDNPLYDARNDDQAYVQLSADYEKVKGEKVICDLPSKCKYDCIKGK